MVYSFRNAYPVRKLFNAANKTAYYALDEVRNVRTTLSGLNLTATEVILPIPNNIDAVEITRFSPFRSRKISAIVILSQNCQGISSPKIDITTHNSFTSDAFSIKQDPHIQSNACFGAISLNPAVQSNVSTTFGGLHKLTHLNMPSGQWFQDCKFMSQNLQLFHHSILRKNVQSNWSTYDKDATIQNKDSCTPLNVHIIRRYCAVHDKPEKKSKPQSKRDQLKQAFKDYGSTIIVFHVTISLLSLGSFYVIVSSGMDLIALLEQFGFSPTALKNSTTLGASNFVIAYAMHKVFAPIRVSITLGATPFIVKYLRTKGLLLQKKH